MFETWYYVLYSLLCAALVFGLAMSFSTTPSASVRTSAALSPGSSTSASIW